MRSMSMSRNYKYHRWFGIRRSTWLLSLYILSYLIYLILGAYLMAWLETDSKENLKLAAWQKKKEFLRNHPNLNETDFEEFLSSVLESEKQGINSKDAELNLKTWSWGQAFLFTVSLVTTIGYGHITPLTQIGKLVCVIYAILGIPFTVVFLSACVQRLLYPTFKLLSLLFASSIGSKMSALKLRLIHLSFLWFVFIIFLVLIPAAIFYVIEPVWTFQDGIYFIFISLTTTGFGDFVPGYNSDALQYRDFYQACVAGYLLVALVFVSLTITVFYDIPQLNLGLHLHQHKDIHLRFEEKD